MRETRHHYAVLLPPLLQTIAAVVIVSVLGTVLTPRSGDGPVDTFLGLVVVAVLVRLLWRGLEWWSDRIVITDLRMFEVSGILTRRVASMPLARLTDLTYSRTLIGRMFGYGDLTVETAGQEQALSHIGYVPCPDDFYRALTALVLMPLPDEAPEQERAVPPSDDADTGPIPRVIT